MPVLYLTLIIFASAGQSLFKKAFTLRAENKGIYFFNTLSSGAGALFFLVTSSGMQWNLALLPYSMIFAFAFSLCAIFTLKALACGALSLTSLVVSYALMIPTFYGLWFLGDPIGPGLIPGIILLAVSLLLINLPDKNSPFSFRWLLYVFLAFIGNGMCSVSQKIQQVAFDGGYKNEFMFLALCMVSAVMLVMSLCAQRTHIKTVFRAGWYLPVLCGILNGLVNLLVMILSGLMPVSVMFPTISAGGLVVTYLISRYVYKETLKPLSMVGFLLGLISVILLNL